MWYMLPRGKEKPLRDMVDYKVYSLPFSIGADEPQGCNGQKSDLGLTSFRFRHQGSTKFSSIPAAIQS